MHLVVQFHNTKYVLEKDLCRKLCVKWRGSTFLMMILLCLVKHKGQSISIPLNVALKVIINNEYVVAVVGTPVNYKRQLPLSSAKLRKLIKYKIGVFCSCNQRMSLVLGNICMLKMLIGLMDGDTENIQGIFTTNTKTGERKY